MSLALIQGYSSEEEAAGNDQLYLSTSDEDDDGDHKENHIVSATFSKPSFHAAKPPAAGSGSVLPSALDAFAEIEGPPQFLNSCVEENISGRDIDHGAARWSRGSSRRKHKEKKDIPVGKSTEKWLLSFCILYYFILRVVWFSFTEFWYMAYVSHGILIDGEKMKRDIAIIYLPPNIGKDQGTKRKSFIINKSNEDTGSHYFIFRNIRRPRRI